MEDDYIDEPDDIFDGEAIEIDAAENVEENDNVANPAEPENPEKIAVPKKRVVKNPRLKFNPERLCGERGIPILMDHFKDVTFKGKGHEVEDLDKLLSTLEHWTHRLFPSMKFLDCLRHIEHLGRKRPVQVCVTKIRLDMPILNDDFISKEINDGQHGANPDTEAALGDEFDQLMAEYQQAQTEAGSELPDSDADDSGLSPNNSAASPIQDFNNTASVSNILTEEQRQRIELNRRLAAERLKSKQVKLSTSVAIHNNEASSLHLRNNDDNNDFKLCPGPSKNFGKSDINSSKSDNNDDENIDELIESSFQSQSTPTAFNDNLASDNTPQLFNKNEIEISKFKNDVKSTEKSSISDDEDVNIDDLVENSFGPSNKHAFLNTDSDSSDDIDYQLLQRKRKKNQFNSDEEIDDLVEKKIILPNKGASNDVGSDSSNDFKSQIHQKKNKKIEIYNNGDSDSQKNSIKKLSVDSDEDIYISNSLENNLKLPNKHTFSDIDSDGDDHMNFPPQRKKRNKKLIISDDDSDIEATSTHNTDIPEVNAIS